MGETKHTPGPYLFVPAIKGFPGLDRHIVVAVSAQDAPLARIDADNETAEANGRLFAAAPDLLAALKAVHERRIAWPTEIEAAVVAALSKATGEQR
jgi:hypothetical protein